MDEIRDAPESAPVPEAAGSRDKSRKNPRKSSVTSFMSSKPKEPEVALQYSDVARTLGQLSQKPSSANEKELENVVLPRLAGYGTPDLSSLPHFQKLLEFADEKKVIRYVFYFMERIFAEQKANGGDTLRQTVLDNAVMTLTPEQDVKKDKEGLRQAFAMRALSTASMAGNEMATLELTKTVLAVLSRMNLGKAKKRSGMTKLMGFGKEDVTQKEAPIKVQSAAYRAIHHGLAGNEELEWQALVGVKCEDPIGARHALAVAVRIAQRDVVKLAEKLEPIVQATLDAASGVMKTSSPHDKSKKSDKADKEKDGDKGAASVINLQDPFAKLHFIQLCAVILHASQMSNKPQLREPYHTHLVAMVQHAEDRVALEAIQGLSAASPPGCGPQERANAWEMMVNSPLKAAKGILSTIVARLEVGLKLPSQPTMSASCHAAEAVAQAHAHFDAETEGGMAGDRDESAKLADMARALQVVLTCRSHHVRGAAIRALIWLRTPTFLPGLMSALGEQLRDPLWPVEPLECIMDTLCTRMQGDPDLTTEMLQGVRLLVEAAPARVNPEIVLGVWKASLAANGPDNLHLTLIGVHEMLGMLHTLRPVSRSPIDTDLQVVAAVHQHMRMAVWFLGENANHAASEYAWTAPRANISSTSAEHRSDTLEDGSKQQSSSLLASAATRNPLMAQAIAELQGCVVAGTWGIRVEAARALGKLAVRSGEPFRMQCYTILAAAQASMLSLSGVTAPIIDVLDDTYSSQERLMELLALYGADGRSWPSEALQEVVETHEECLEQAGTVCFVPATLYLPLGLDSALIIKEAEKRGKHPSI